MRAGTSGRGLPVPCSWTTDSGLTCAVLDTTDTTTTDHVPLARSLRRELWAEHLGTDASNTRLDDPRRGFELFDQSARALDQWHLDTTTGPRPYGQLRRHRPEPISRLQRLWANPVNRIAIDPDNRPRRIRGTTRF